MESAGKPRVVRVKIGRRRFLLIAGGAAGAAVLAGAGLTMAGTSQQPEVQLVESTYGEANPMNGKILIAYASQGGSTAGVADVLGKQLAANGATVDVRPVKEVTDLGAYRAVVVGSAIHGGKWLPEAVKFVEANQSRLGRMPTAYFLVSMMVARGKEEDLRIAAGWLEPVRALVKPVAEGRFAGALWPGKHPLLEGVGLRIFLACIGMTEGDYRDWGAIRAWADSTRPLLLA